MNLKPNLFNHNEVDCRFPYDEADTVNLFSRKLVSYIPSSMVRPVIIICIGTDRSTGDSLGPLVGSKLHEKDTSYFHVYGTLDEPIHAVNLEEQLIKIKRRHHNPFIIAIDACLGRLNSVGIISIGDGPVKPGAGVNKQLPSVGDIHITGIVNVSGFMEFFVLQNTRLSLVMKMASAIADGISEASKQLERKQALSRTTWEQSRIQ